MTSGYSLRRRLIIAMVGTFLLGLAALLVFEYLESIEIKAPAGVEVVIEVLLLTVPFLVGGLLIWLVVGWSLQPLTRASRQAGLIGPTDPKARISEVGLPQEIQPLVGAINGALDRLADAYEAERRLTADAAHELRTPLAVLSLRLQRAKLDQRLDWSAIEGDIARMSRLVGQIIDLARKEAAGRHGSDEERGNVNLARVARESAAMMLPLVEQAGRSLEVDAVEAVMVIGRQDHLVDMIGNLIENALVHGLGVIRVRVASDMDRGAGRAIVDVCDEGPGIPEDAQEALFARFRKGTARSRGAGLGLAIVREVARAHGGDASFVPGPGCVVRVSLPLAS